MYFYKKEDGSIVSCYKHIDGLEAITEKAFNERMNITTAKLEKLAILHEKTRPLTADEVNRLFLMQNINTVITDDATASRAVEFHPEMKYDGSLVSAGTRINWHGTLKRAAVDLWDAAENNPDNAPTLWADLAYKDGYRIIPETITVTTAFAEGEYGWWGDVLYKSKVGSNVYTPEQYAPNWEQVTL